MANPFDEVKFEAQGKVFTFKFGTYARIVLERATKTPLQKFLERNKDEWFSEDMTALFRAGLARHHSDLDEFALTDLMDDLGDEKIGEIFSEAFKVANPKSDDKARPRSRANQSSSSSKNR